MLRSSAPARESILAVAKEPTHTREDIRVKWLRYEKALQVILVEGHKLIIIEHAKQIASKWISSFQRNCGTASVGE